LSQLHVVVLFESYEGDKEQKKMVAMAVGGRMGSAAAAAPVSATPNEHINASVQRQLTPVVVCDLTRSHYRKATDYATGQYIPF